MTIRETEAAAPQPYPPPAASWFAASVLMLAYVLAFVDRQIMSLLITPIKRDLHLSDTEVSLLIGLAFALCYTLAGLPFGWLVDRWSRKGTAILGVVAWSAMTGLCGVAGGYNALFAARIGVGLGEAAISPASYSLLSDSFPPARLVRAISLYTGGAFIGIALAFLGGSRVVAWTEGLETVAVPLVGAVRGWQVPFLVLMLPGAVVAILLALLREPARRRAPVAAVPVSATGFARAAGLPLVLIFVAMGCQSIVVQAVLSWTPTLLARRFGWATVEIGTALGLIVLTVGLGGNYLGAALGSRLFARGRRDGLLRVCLYSGVVLAVVGPAATLAPSAPTVLVLIAGTLMLTGMPASLAPAAVQLLCPPHLRGRVTSLYILTTQLIGATIGPTLVALFTDRVFRDEMAIGSSQAATAAVGSVLAAIAFALALRPYRRALGP